MIMDKKNETVSSVSSSVMQEEIVSSSPGAEMYVKVAVIGILLYVYFFEAVNSVVGKWLPGALLQLIAFALAHIPGCEIVP